MAEHQHLPLPSAQIDMPRRKRGGFPGGREIDPAPHAARLTAILDAAVGSFRQQGPVGPVQPSLIMKVETTGYTPEVEWAAADLSILATDKDQTLIVMSSDSELARFREKLARFAEGPREGAVTPPGASLIAPIESVSLLTPEERLGDLIREAGIQSSDDFSPIENYSLDVELWHISPRVRRLQQIADIEKLVEDGGGEVLDRYLGGSLTLLRVAAPGGVFADLAELSDVRSIDLPPMVDAGVGELLDLSLADFPHIPEVPAGAPSLTIIDSGVSSEHPLLEPAIGECIAVPDTLALGDPWGHGTKVAGIAVYGDLRAKIEAGTVAPGVLLHSARVLMDDGKFPDNQLVVSQMRAAITYFHEAHGCRVFNISLGDPRTVYNGRRVSTWAAVLDELARELDIVIVVSAGNLKYKGGSPEHSWTEYPGYLFDDSSAILEPASAALAVTVGSLSHAASVPEDEKDRVGLQPIAPVDGPSPFTRTGPAEASCSKPDLCDYGGNLTFDAIAQTVTAKSPPNGIFTLHSDYLSQLFTTTIGTSLAAPHVAYKASLIAEAFPDASANLIRALLSSSAKIPQSTESLLGAINADAVRRACGAGVPNLQRAIFSDDHRVTMFTDSVIGQDQFFVYEIPIVEDFLQHQGHRQISVTLAFDPPVRHTRADYLGNRMSFRLERGGSLDQVIDFYRQRKKVEGPADRCDSRECAMLPSPTRRELSTLQKATFSMSRRPRDYGDTYYLVVRCEGRWADPGEQRFAVVVTLEHQNAANLYARIAERIGIRGRVRL